jgi:hypothetical protein
VKRGKKTESPRRNFLPFGASREKKEEGGRRKKENSKKKACVASCVCVPFNNRNGKEKERERERTKAGRHGCDLKIKIESDAWNERKAGTIMVARG